jgi:hypothetical protein
MTGTELFDKVAEHPDLEGMGLFTTDRGPTAQVRFKPNGSILQFPFEALQHITWEQLEPILTCKREPHVLTHMSRVVGYFSRIENWNQSKIGELKDRHRGNYALTETVAQ